MHSITNLSCREEHRGSFFSDNRSIKGDISLHGFSPRPREYFGNIQTRGITEHTSQTPQNLGLKHFSSRVYLTPSREYIPNKSYRIPSGRLF